jgi:hypothetical protein
MVARVAAPSAAGHGHEELDHDGKTEWHRGSLESSGLLSLSTSRADAFLGALWGAS